MDYYAIGQCTPGVIAVNTATFVGQGLAGPIGGIVATLGVVFPSLIIITVIAAFIQNFAHLAIVQNAFAGIRVCVCVLIFNAVVKLWKKGGYRYADPCDLPACDPRIYTYGPFSDRIRDFRGCGWNYPENKEVASNDDPDPTFL